MANKPLMNYSKNRWIFFIITASLTGGILSILAVYQFAGAWIGRTALFLLGAGITGSLLLILALLNKHHEQLNERIDNNFEEVERELKAAINIQPFTKFPLKLDTRQKGYAATALFIERIIQEIVINKPDLIVECGSGSSTLALAGCLKKMGSGTLISLDHDSGYSARTQKRITAEALDSLVSIIHSPIKSRTLENSQWQWYDFQPDQHLKGSIDMLIVDGPPGDIHPMVRYPAVPILEKHLSDHCMIILDDTNRSEEMKTAKLWAKLLNAPLGIVEDGRGYCIIRK